MALRERKKNPEIIPDMQEESIEKDVIVSEPPKYTDMQLKSFREQAIMVLNILDEKGINIYDNNRYGGMYLHGNRNANQEQSLIQKIKMQEKPVGNHEESEEKAPNNLLNLFK